MEPHNLEALPAGLAFIAFFLVVWIGTITLVGKFSGWQRLVKEFHQGAMPAPLGGGEKKFYWQTGRIGWSSYKNCLNVSTSRYGLTLSMMKLFSFGHPPLFIPWQKVTSLSHKSVFLIPLSRLTLSDAKQTVLQLPSKIFENNSHVPPQLQGAVKETENPYNDVSS